MRTCIFSSGLKMSSPQTSKIQVQAKKINSVKLTFPVSSSSITLPPQKQLKKPTPETIDID